MVIFNLEEIRNYVNRKRFDFIQIRRYVSKSEIFYQGQDRVKEKFSWPGLHKNIKEIKIRGKETKKNGKFGYTNGETKVYKRLKRVKESILTNKQSVS